MTETPRERIADLWSRLKDELNSYGGGLDINILFPNLPFGARSHLLETSVGYFRAPEISRGDSGAKLKPHECLLALETPTSISIVGDDIEGRHLQIYLFTDRDCTEIELEITFFEPEQIDRELSDDENIERLGALVRLSDKLKEVSPDSRRVLCDGGYHEGAEIALF